MKSLPLLATVAVLALPPVILAADASPPLTSEQLEVVKVSEARMEAFNRRDFPTYSRFSATDFLGVDGDGSTYERPKDLTVQPKDFALPPAHLQYLDRRNLQLRVHGDTAVLTYLVTVINRYGEAKITSQWRALECFQKRDGIWVEIAVSETPAPVDQRKAVAMDLKALGEFVGQYEWAPGEVETITLEDGHLMSEMPGDPKRAEILFADVNTQFMRGDEGLADVLRDPQGRLLGYRFHRPNSEGEINVKKIR